MQKSNLVKQFEDSLRKAQVNRSDKLDFIIDSIKIILKGIDNMDKEFNEHISEIKTRLDSIENYIDIC